MSIATLGGQADRILPLTTHVVFSILWIDDTCRLAYSTEGFTLSQKPDAALTAVQFGILQVVWDRPDGATVAEIWDAMPKGRDVARTTVLNLVSRLDKRGWLKRRKCDGVFRYTATIDRDTATATFAGKFVDDFFDGSAKDLVMSLLGSKRISQAEVDELRQLLQNAGAHSRK
jgi:BlaI family penicillinase repressor